MKIYIISVLSIFTLFSCESRQGIQGEANIIAIDSIQPPVIEKQVIPEYKEFDRTEIIEKLQYKIDNTIPLVAHVLVPLCDNENQGIVPTTASLGNGQSLRSNLYWATSNGMKRYFKEKVDWKMLKSEVYSKDSIILERVTFKKTYKNGAQVYLIADAYRGDTMEDCLKDFFQSLSGELMDTVFVNSDTILINSKADLVAFNGHNGLMDVYVDELYNNDNIQKDAVVIACSSMYDFNERLNFLQAYPLIMTTNLLYPGAFVMEGVINNWALMKSEEEIRLSAGDAYHRVKQCGVNGARNLFSTGW
jgi:hypothetical protein